MESLFYCPVSARFSSSSFELHTPVDTPIRRFEVAETALRKALDALHYRVGPEIVSASDALFAAFSYQEGLTLLVSRTPFSGDDLEAITDELLVASACPEISGIRASKVSPTGHVVVVVDYVPVEGRLQSVEHAEALIDALTRIHDAGVVHGGINERFVNPEAPANRRVFGIGLSCAYAAWRRDQGLTIGDLRADPRFASPAELRGDDASAAGDAFALAAVILSQSQTPGEAIPPLDPVQGVNALLAKAGQGQLLRQFAGGIADKRVRRSLETMIDPSRAPEIKIWRVAVFASLGLIVLMLLWLITRPEPKVAVLAQPDSPVTRQGGAQCQGPGLREVDGVCELAEGYGRCGTGTRYDAAARACAAQPNDDAPAVDEVPETAAAAIPEGPHIHPVLTCAEGQRMSSMRYSFSNSDISFTQVERAGFTRMAAQCGGPASVVYYTSNPTLEARANTIFDELRSSSICGTKCRENLPADPTAVVYVPYIGLIDRASAHYLFLHCCI